MNGANYLRVFFMISYFHTQASGIREKLKCELDVRKRQRRKFCVFFWARADPLEAVCSRRSRDRIILMMMMMMIFKNKCENIDTFQRETILKPWIPQVVRNSVWILILDGRALFFHTILHVPIWFKAFRLSIQNSLF